MGMALNRVPNMLHTFRAAGVALFALGPGPAREAVVTLEEMVLEEVWGI